LAFEPARALVIIVTMLMLRRSAGPRQNDMRVSVVGASGAVGSRLLLLLLTAGHTVAGLTRTLAKADAIRLLLRVPGEGGCNSIGFNEHGHDSAITFFSPSRRRPGPMLPQAPEFDRFCDRVPSDSFTPAALWVPACAGMA
jgi:hypothetical protein